jgi:hypothetical protein
MKLLAWLRGTPPTPIIENDHVWLPSINIPSAAWHPLTPQSKAAVLRAAQPRRRTRRVRALTTALAPAF